MDKKTCSQALDTICDRVSEYALVSGNYFREFSCFVGDVRKDFLFMAPDKRDIIIKDMLKENHVIDYLKIKMPEVDAKLENLISSKPCEKITTRDFLELYREDTIADVESNSIYSKQIYKQFFDKCLDVGFSSGTIQKAQNITWHSTDNGAISSILGGAVAVGSYLATGEVGTSLLLGAASGVASFFTIDKLAYLWLSSKLKKSIGIEKQVYVNEMMRLQ